MELLTYQDTKSPTEIVAFPKKDPDVSCNGKIHRQERYCQQPAGWGTSHVGIGRCKLHGGCSTGRGSGKLRYSDYVPTAIIEKYEVFSVEPDIDIKSLNDEIAMIRAKITQLQNDSKFADNSDNRMLLQFTELLRRLVETKQKVEEGIKSKVNIEIAVKLVDNVIKIIDKTVTDPTVKRKIATEMRELNFSELGISPN